MNAYQGNQKPQEIDGGRLQQFEGFPGQWCQNRILQLEQLVTQLIQMNDQSTESNRTCKHCPHLRG